MNILQRIDRLKAELDALRPLDVEREGRIMQKFRLDWNYHSNHLEGNSLTYGETKALILFGITAQGKPLKDHLEMTGHNEAIKWIEEVVKEERPLMESFIRQLHVLLLKEPSEKKAITPEGVLTTRTIEVGKYKTVPNHVLTNTGEIFYFATPEETPAKMHDLMEWYRVEKEKGELHPLLLAAEFHYKFIIIHPFDDGNGRTARILMNFILMQHGLPPVVIKTEDKENYFAALRQADAGLLEPFIEYIGENLARSLDLMVRGAKGESIDEPDDVDKEIALLEQSLATIESGIEKVKSKEILMDLFEVSLVHLIDDFINKNKKFEQFYDTTSFFIEIKINISNKINLDLKKEDFTRIIKWEITQNGSLDSLVLSCAFTNFKKNGIEPFNNEENLEVIFLKNNYIVRSHKLIIKKLYHQKLYQEDIQSIVRENTKAHTAFINQKIEEAQQKRTPEG